MSNTNAKLIKKISTKTVLGGPANIREAKDGNIMRVFGIMRGMRTGTTKHNLPNGETHEQPFVAFRGQFQAINLITGEIFASGEAFLPDVAGSVVENAFKTAQESDNPAESMQFAFDISKQTDDSCVVGYVFGATPLLPPTENDPLLEMASNLPNPAQIEDKSEKKK